MNRARRLAGQVARRPARDATPPRRPALRGPHSNSFPAGHSASAAAFAVALLVAVLAVRPAALTVYRGRDSRR